MKHIKPYNEAAIDFLKSKISKDEVIKKVMEQPDFNRWDYITDNQLEDVFTEKELKEFEDLMIYVDYSDYKLMYAETNNKRYYAVKEENDLYIFDENWDKVTGGEYNEFKEAVELFKLRMG